MVRLKKVGDQVIVIVGASSGIGLATARMAAKQGARLVLAARSENALRELVTEIHGAGGDAIYVVADVTHEEDIQRIADTAIQNYGGFDTWINDVGVGMYGKITDIPISDMRSLFETNVWGMVSGSQIAVRHLRQRGGALINLGSTVSERAIPLQGVYSATKHAIKAFTDALRMELESEGAPISVTLIKPGPIDTPFPINAKNYLGVEPKHVPPVYAPNTVAEAILHAAEHPIRDIYVGSGALVNAMANNTPGLADQLGKGVFMPGTMTDKPAPMTNSLDTPTEHLAERGNYPGKVNETSLYTEAVLHPMLAGAIAVGIGAVGAALLHGAKNGTLSNLAKQGADLIGQATGKTAAPKTDDALPSTVALPGLTPGDTLSVAPNATVTAAPAMTEVVQEVPKTSATVPTSFAAATTAATTTTDTTKSAALGDVTFVAVADSSGVHYTPGQGAAKTA